jgi:hypothetical protein
MGWPLPWYPLKGKTAARVTVQASSATHHHCGSYGWIPSHGFAGGLMENLFEIGARLSWRAGVLAAATSGLVFHLLAVALAPSAGLAGKPVDLGLVAGRGLASIICSLLQFAVPAALLIGAVISFLKHGQAKVLFSEAEEGGLGDGPKTVLVAVGAAHR